jgi:UDP-N-acetylmuramyl pentapeptide phosphotransferase/UDP-N-acetylglucosamine-1-phosphate transferase
MIHFLLFVLLLVLEVLYFKIASHFNIKDKPNERSSHYKATLLGGGVVFVFALLIYSFFFGFNYPWLLAGALLLATISYIDDVKPQSPKLRLVIQFASLLLMFVDLELFSYPLLLIVAALVVAAGVLNAYNFMDGINGMLGMTSMVVLGGLIYINLNVVSFTDANLLYLMLMSVVVFNIFNFRTKAKCFAGDVGAFTMGFILIYFITRLIIVTGDTAWIAMLAIYGVDTILTIIHRIYLGENLTQPHRKHLFQLLANELRFSHLFVSLLYAFLQLLIIVGLIAARSYAYVVALLSILFISSCYVVIKQRYFYLHEQKTA